MEYKSNVYVYIYTCVYMYVCVAVKFFLMDQYMKQDKILNDISVIISLINT